VASKKMEWVTNDFVQDIHPVWSADGGSIFFSSYRGGGINVWRIPVDLDGAPAGQLEQITAGSGHDVDLDVTRSDNRLVFATLRQNADIWKVPIEPSTGTISGPAEQVVATTRENSRGAWSPDGRQIAFNSDRGGDMNLWLVSLNDGRARQLTRGPGGDFQPTWSPDGKSLVFFSGRSGAVDIWRFDFEGDVLTRLTDGHGININPFFSQDGQRIAFHSDRDGRLEVWVMNHDGSEPRQLTTVGASGHFVRWSPDGSGVYFRCPVPPSPGVRVVPASGGEPLAFPTLVGGSHISFSPDHSSMMDVIGHRALWLSPLDGSPARKVFEFDDPESRIDYPVWSPDGRWILFDRFVPRGGDVWTVEGF
jgi:Tol biopolymer transport system component